MQEKRECSGCIGFPAAGTAPFTTGNHSPSPSTSAVPFLNKEQKTYLLQVLRFQILSTITSLHHSINLIIICIISGHDENNGCCEKLSVTSQNRYWPISTLRYRMKWKRISVLSSLFFENGTMQSFSCSKSSLGLFHSFQLTPWAFTCKN